MQRIICSLFIIMVLVMPTSVRANQHYQNNNLRTEDSVFKEITPRSLLKDARIVYVKSHSTYLKSSLFENALRNRKEFQECGMFVTENEEQADLVIEIERAIFTNVFIFKAIDRRSQLVVASGRANSFFGTASGKLAKNFAKQLKAAKQN